MASVRLAAVAGSFYPRDARALAAELEDLLGGVEELAPRLGFPKALVVPHAGYIYSGPVAAHAYRLVFSPCSTTPRISSRATVRRPRPVLRRARAACRKPGPQSWIRTTKALTQAGRVIVAARP